MPQRLYHDRALGFDIYWVSRAEWGSLSSTEQYIAGRRVRGKLEKTELHIHHTAVAGPTPHNLWSFVQAMNYQRSLQWVRPDLGPLPYPENAAINLEMDAVWLFEGRGHQVSGAHTAGHNTQGTAIGFLGNFDLATPARALSIARRTVEVRGSMLRHDEGYSRLGNSRNPRGWEVWGHRDSSAKSCPGNRLYPLLDTVRFINRRVTTMVDRTTDYGGNPNLAAEYQKKLAQGVYSEHTRPGHIVFADSLAAFLNRESNRVTAKMIAAAVAGASLGQVDAGGVIDEIIRRLSGGG